MTSAHLEKILNSTPQSKTITDVALPKTPNKKTLDKRHLKFFEQHLNFDKKKNKIQKFHSSRKLLNTKIPKLVSPSPVIKSNSRTILPQFLTFNNENTKNNCEEEEENDSILIGGSPIGLSNSYDSEYNNRIFSPLYNDINTSHSTLISPLELPNPFSPNSSRLINSINHEYGMHSTDNDLHKDRPLLNEVTNELNRIIRSSILDDDNNAVHHFNSNNNNMHLSSLYPIPILQNTENILSENNFMCGKKKLNQPLHRIKEPKRSILKIRPNSLNFMVSSSKDSLEDATIFGTEINTLLSKDRLNIPKIVSPLQKVTIPVNSSVKRKHKLQKRELLTGKKFLAKFSDEKVKEILMSFDEGTKEDDESPDVAIIRGYEFERLVSKNKYPVSQFENFNSKSITWNL